jgi:Kef-type K+ transport system membrane component KefB
VDAELTRRTSLGLSFAAAYASMIGGGVLLFLLIRRYGETLAAPAPPGGGLVARAPAGGSSDVVLHVLLALAAVIVLGRLLGAAVQRIGQPPVIGEVLAGIVLGPSLLGQVSPAAAAYVLPPSVAPYLSIVAQLGIILYMFLVGLELNGELLRRRAQTTVATSHASIVAPFVLGSALALYLYPRVSTSDVPFTSFALFMGVAMSITAFPVLARILTDRGMSKTELGAIALTCAAADDVTAWCLLALVVGVAQARVQDALVVSGLALSFIAIMFFCVRPMVLRLLVRRDGQSGGAATAFAGLLVSALAAEWIGIHAVFGAFLFGAVIPHDSRIARQLTERLQDLVTVLFLPAFFAFTGMRTEIGLLTGAGAWRMCGLIIIVATAGKFGGTVAAARLTGMPLRQAASLGALMNTRGLMELVVLNIGLDLGVMSPTLFTMMVLMALATTAATTPALQLIGAAPAWPSALRSAPEAR